MVLVPDKWVDLAKASDPDGLTRHICCGDSAKKLAIFFKIELNRWKNKNLSVNLPPDEINRWEEQGLERYPATRGS